MKNRNEDLYTWMDRVYDEHRNEVADEDRGFWDRLHKSQMVKALETFKTLLVETPFKG